MHVEKEGELGVLVRQGVRCRFLGIYPADMLAMRLEKHEIDG